MACLDDDPKTPCTNETRGWCKASCGDCFACHAKPCEKVCVLKDGRSCDACLGCVDGDKTTECPKWCATDCKTCGQCMEKLVEGGKKGGKKGGDKLLKTEAGNPNKPCKQVC